MNNFDFIVGIARFDKIAQLQKIGDKIYIETNQGDLRTFAPAELWTDLQIGDIICFASIGDERKFFTEKMIMSTIAIIDLNGMSFAESLHKMAEMGGFVRINVWAES